MYKAWGKKNDEFDYIKIKYFQMLHSKKKD
jgi:hypothetical protein